MITPGVEILGFFFAMNKRGWRDREGPDQWWSVWFEVGGRIVNLLRIFFTIITTVDDVVLGFMRSGGSGCS